MKIYTVHEPPPRKGRTIDANRFVFVRDGFHFWAFLLGPLWMIRRRLWLVLLLYIVVLVAVQVGLTLLGVSNRAQFAVGALIALLIGFEASSLRRWTYGRRRWRLHGVVVAPDLEGAERRFFDAYVTPPPPESDYPPPLPPMRAPVTSNDVIGLFPEPEPRPR